MEISAPEPCPISTPKAASTIMYGMVSARPAKASGPTAWPRYNRSTTLYRQFTKLDAMAGNVNRINRRGMGSVPMKSEE